MYNNNLIPTRDELEVLQTISKSAAESKYFNSLGGVSGIFTIALYARELGVSPMTAIFGGFSNINGKLTMSAELMNSLIRRAGHKLQIETCNNELCTIKGERCDTKETARVSFTLVEAKSAGLVRAGGSWDKYTSDMLFARCLSRLRRRLFPDIATKAYVDGELDEDIEPVAKVKQYDYKPEPIEVDELISFNEVIELESYFEATPERREKALAFFKRGSFEDFTKKDYAAAKKMLNKSQAQCV